MISTEKQYSFLLAHFEKHRLLLQTIVSSAKQPNPGKFIRIDKYKLGITFRKKKLFTTPSFTPEKAHRNDECTKEFRMTDFQQRKEFFQVFSDNLKLFLSSRGPQKGFDISDLNMGTQLCANQQFSSR